MQGQLLPFPLGISGCWIFNSFIITSNLPFKLSQLKHHALQLRVNTSYQASREAEIPTVAKSDGLAAEIVS